MMRQLFGRGRETELNDLVESLYRGLLGRAPDEQGLRDHVASLVNGSVTPAHLVRSFLDSAEFRQKAGPKSPLDALHQARVVMVRQLPRARRIVDLGGGAANIPDGALVYMGYPYDFEQLTIVEPLAEGRHEIYQNIPSGLNEVITQRGPVRYLYRSMSDLAPIESGSIDLVFSGESIEHISQADCVQTLREARRVLKPSGSLCFDTPNRGLTRIQIPDGYINPDHKYEYTNAEMKKFITDAGFTITEEKGIAWMPQSRQTGAFDLNEMIAHPGVYDDIENCYLLYYRCVIGS